MSDLECTNCGREFQSPEDYLQGTSCFKVCSEGHLWFECSCHSCLMLRQGDFDWYSPDMSMSKEAGSIFNKIELIKEVPRIPSSISAIKKMIDDEKKTSAQLEDTLKNDPPMVLNIIEFANNLKGRSENQIESLSHAVSYIGRKNLYQIVQAAAMKNFEFNSNELDPQAFWRESAITGYVAELLVEEIAPNLKEERDKIYLAASLCGIGKIIMAICFEDHLKKIHDLMANPKNQMNWKECEAAVGAFDYTILGEIAGALWGLPKYTLRSIRFHSSEPNLVRSEVKNQIMFFGGDDMPSESEQKVGFHDVVSLAVQYSYWAMLRPEKIEDNLFQSYCKKCEISSKDRDRLGGMISEAVSHKFSI